jgi:hypothetical protein
MKKTYHRLVLKGPENVDIWLSDPEGFLVQKETGRMDTSLLPGNYYVQLGLDGEKAPLRLDRNLALLIENVNGRCVLRDE